MNFYHAEFLNFFVTKTWSNILSEFFAPSIELKRTTFPRKEKNAKKTFSPFYVEFKTKALMFSELAHERKFCIIYSN